jgi:hypothetical protein
MSAQQIYIADLKSQAGQAWDSLTHRSISRPSLGILGQFIKE